MADEARSTVTRIREELIEAANRLLPTLDRSSLAAFAAGAIHGDALLALAGVEAALEHHERVDLYGNAATEGEPGNCPHSPDSALHFEDPDSPGEWLCKGRPEGSVCSTCTEEGLPVAFPCPERESILEALTGKAADHAEG